MAHIPHALSEVCAQLTVSIGVAVIQPSSGRVSAELVAAADEQLYQAKSKGRGRALGRVA
jgi:diguanylate cyclase (GGDEF)-like protein